MATLKIFVSRAMRNVPKNCWVWSSPQPCGLPLRSSRTLLSCPAELEKSFSSAALSDAHFSSQTLVGFPLFQSIYAETLRLRIRAYAARYTDRSELQINEWAFPKKSIILVSTTLAHIDSPSRIPKTVNIQSTPSGRIGSWYTPTILQAVLSKGKPQKKFRRRLRPHPTP